MRQRVFFSDNSTLLSELVVGTLISSVHAVQKPIEILNLHAFRLGEAHLADPSFACPHPLIRELSFFLNSFEIRLHSPNLPSVFGA